MSDRNQTDILIIGAGAAGLMAAAGAARTFEGKGKITLLEKMPRPARKIMITGKGRCNFTNAKPWNDFLQHIHPKADFIKSSFYNLNPEKLIELFTDAGMESVVERGDRAYPSSYKASDVVDTLCKMTNDNGAEIHCGKQVEKCVKTEDGFVVECSDGQSYTSKAVIICTGGLSYPSTGSDGDGYRFAEGFGHSVRELFPSLTALVPKGYKTEMTDIQDENIFSTKLRGHIHRSTPLSETGKLLCGNSLKNIGLTLFADGNEVQTEFGDIDFTDGGLEGPIGFKISRKCVAAILHGSKVSISIDLKPAVELDSLSSRISNLFDTICKDRRSVGKPYRERFKVLLGKVIPQSLIPAFIKSFPNADHKTLAKTLKNWKMEISGYVGYERCVVTAGGINREEIVPKTLESRLVPGLYFAGEIMDIDADTGGYNLHCAFSTGYLAGISAAKKLAKDW